jgi:methionyl-tRNA synthetase
MKTEAVSTVCDTKGCTELATTTCDRCGRLYCPLHVRHLVVQRREESTAQSTHLGTLARLPIRSEIYALCTSCRTKPVPLK